MTIEIIEKYPLSIVPSISGIEVWEEKIYLIGDDSAYVYIMDANLQFLQTVQLFKSRRKPGEKIPKLLKADLEAMAVFQWHERPFLLMLGSGSLAVQRERGYLLNLHDHSQVLTVDLSKLYAMLQKEYGIEELNIEGLTATKSNLYMVQRGNLHGDNYLLKFDMEALICHLLGHEALPPKPISFPFDLGGYQQWLLGFTGLHTLNEQMLLATLTVEATDSTYLDGQVMGSFVGLIDLNSHPPVIEKQQLAFQGAHILEKAESLAVWQQKSDHEYILLLATDNDDQPSSIYKARLTV
ncbi:MAG: hypothetical protein SFW35_06105 [Chitinophagales bacterium]|nr:hypothetical protein [Chitinophagales bacterium]